MGLTTVGQFDEPEEEKPSPRSLPGQEREDGTDLRAKAAEILPAEYQVLFETYCRFLEACPHLAAQQARLNYLDFLVAQVLVREMRQRELSQLRQLGSAAVRMQFMTTELLSLKAQIDEMNPL